jgi:hypothetical protein
MEGKKVIKRQEGKRYATKLFISSYFMSYASIPENTIIGRFMKILNVRSRIWSPNVV